MGISFLRYSSTLCARIYSVISLIALFSITAQCQISFRKPDFDVGRMPVAIAAGDFNRDGKLDLAVLNQADATVGVYFGNGNGSFAHNADYPTVPDSGFPAAMAAADFNNDGILDLAVVNGAATASIYLGKADGSFIFTSSLSVPSFAITGPIAIADFNQDGKPDLLVQSEACDRGGCFGAIMI